MFRHTALLVPDAFLLHAATQCCACFFNNLPRSSYLISTPLSWFAQMPSTPSFPAHSLSYKSFSFFSEFHGIHPYPLVLVFLPHTGATFSLNWELSNSSRLFTPWLHFPQYQSQGFPHSRSSDIAQMLVQKHLESPSEFFISNIRSHIIYLICLSETFLPSWKIPYFHNTSISVDLLFFPENQDPLNLQRFATFNIQGAFLSGATSLN